MQNQYRFVPNLSAIPYFLFVFTCLCAFSATAATHIVTQSGTSFSPSNLEINEGDTVQWNWTGGSHTVTNGTAINGSEGNLFDESLNGINTVVTYTFDDTGTFPYFCRPHIGLNMRGIITVVAAADTTPPVITILGQNPITIDQNSIYNDAGATATDDVDGTITNNIVTVSNVNTAILGAYTVTYNVSDAAQNAATQKTRNVTVEDLDTIPPEITILGDNPVYVELNGVYVDEGATAQDDIDGDITDNIVTSNAVNTAFILPQFVRYNVSDNAGNNAIQASRTVNITPALDPANVYVDGSNDTFQFGTDLFPFKTIADAIAVAENEAKIFIAPGSYDETFNSSSITAASMEFLRNGVGTVRIGATFEALISISGFQTRSLPLKLKDNQDE